MVMMENQNQGSPAVHLTTVFWVLLLIEGEGKGMAEGGMDVSVREVALGGMLSTGACEFES